MGDRPNRDSLRLAYRLIEDQSPIDVYLEQNKHQNYGLRRAILSTKITLFQAQRIECSETRIFQPKLSSDGHYFVVNLAAILIRDVQLVSKFTNVANSMNANCALSQNNVGAPIDRNVFIGQFKANQFLDNVPTGGK